MAIIKERVDASEFVPSWVRFEHIARYEFAATFARGKRVVDCACGDGTGSAMFKKAGAAEVLAFDISDETIEHASKSHQASNVQFAVGKAGDLPVAAKSVDLYLSLETIEHLEDEHPLLGEAARILKPDGIFICSTPNRYVTNPGTTIHSRPCNPFHVREYDTDEFATLLKGYFAQIELFGQNPQITGASRVMNAIGRFLPFHGAVRINQLLKLPRFLYDRLESHRVMSIAAHQVFEYQVAVCRGPIQPA